MAACRSCKPTAERPGRRSVSSYPSRANFTLRPTGGDGPTALSSCTGRPSAPACTGTACRQLASPYTPAALSRTRLSSSLAPSFGSSSSRQALSTQYNAGGWRTVSSTPMITTYGGVAGRWDAESPEAAETDRACRRADQSRHTRSPGAIGLGTVGVSASGRACRLVGVASENTVRSTGG